MNKKLNIYNHIGVTEADHKAILEAIENESNYRDWETYRILSYDIR